MSIQSTAVFTTSKSSPELPRGLQHLPSLEQRGVWLQVIDIPKDAPKQAPKSMGQPPPCTANTFRAVHGGWKPGSSWDNGIQKLPANMRDCKKAGKGTYLRLGDGFRPLVPAGTPILSMRAGKEVSSLKDCKLLGSGFT